MSMILDQKLLEKICDAASAADYKTKYERVEAKYNALKSIVEKGIVILKKQDGVKLPPSFQGSLIISSEVMALCIKQKETNFALVNDPDDGFRLWGCGMSANAAIEKAIEGYEE